MLPGPPGPSGATSSSSSPENAQNDVITSLPAGLVPRTGVLSPRPFTSPASAVPVPATRNAAMTATPMSLFKIGPPSMTRLASFRHAGQVPDDRYTIDLNEEAEFRQGLSGPGGAAESYLDNHPPRHTRLVETV